MSQAKWSTGIEARPRGLSRFDIPPHCVEVAACHAPPSRVGTPRYACPWRSACRIALEWHAVLSGVAAGAWALTNWDTPLLVSRIAFIPSGLRNAASSLESSLIVQVEISSQPREHASVQGAGEKGRLLCPCVPLWLDNTPPVTFLYKNISSVRSNPHRRTFENLRDFLGSHSCA